MKLEQIIEGTVLLILVYLVLTNFVGFSSAANSVSSLYTSSVRTLQGR